MTFHAATGTVTQDGLTIYEWTHENLSAPPFKVERLRTLPTTMKLAAGDDPALFLASAIESMNAPPSDLNATLTALLLSRAKRTIWDKEERQ